MRILGVDYGRKRIGLAVSDPTHSVAQSLKVLNRKSLPEDIKQIKSIIKRQDVGIIVFGMPKNMDGSLGSMAKEIIGFIEKIKGYIHLPTVTWDERLTTVASERMLIQADVSRKKRKKVIDKVAACVMLQNYLNWRRK